MMERLLLARAPFRLSHRTQSLAGLLLSVIDRFGEPGRSHASSQKQAVTQFAKSRGWIINSPALNKADSNPKHLDWPVLYSVRKQH